jgi:hypothetical protein
MRAALAAGMHEVIFIAGLFGALVLAGCASPSSRPARVVSTAARGLSTEPSRTEVNGSFERPPSVPLADPRDIEERRDSEIFRALQPQLLGCYTKRLATHPGAHAYVTFDVLVGADGRPRDVATTGGASLGSDALGCITGHVRRAAFAPPVGGGTSRVRVPFAFHPDAAGDDG